MVDKRKSTPLRVKRGGGYLKLNRLQTNAPPYKGVRMRVWGKWVTEVRDPVTKTRIWLGSFATAEMAARAYDAAVVCLKGPSAPEVNFPHSIPSFVIPQSISSPKEIQAVAFAAATASIAVPAAPVASAMAAAPPPAAPELPPPECSSSCSTVEDWINKEFDDFDAIDCETDPLSHDEFSELMEQPFMSWPTVDDFDDTADCSMQHHDMQLWSFA